MPFFRRLIVSCISLCYGMLSALGSVRFAVPPWRSDRTGHHPAHPVISVGSIYAGGTGKTPLALDIARHFLHRGITPAFLSRGYKRRSSEHTVVEPHAEVDWTTIGDEPMLLHTNCPEAYLGIGPKRRAGTRALDGLLPPDSVYIMDDGFQHRRLPRDLDIVCVPACASWRTMLQYGIVRELPGALRRSDIVCIVTQDGSLDAARATKRFIAAAYGLKHIFILVQQPGIWVNLFTREQRNRPPAVDPLVLTGIAHPERFIAMVNACGIQPAATAVFADHHAFSRQDITGLLQSQNQPILTTEKDAVRLRRVHFVYSLNIWYLTLRYAGETVSEKKDLYTLIDTLLT
jgi:tetraacyldisaccharide 4'-kinase